MNNPRIEKGPAEVLRALETGEPSLDEALEFQRESFCAKFGCYPEEGILEDCGHTLAECRCDDDDEKESEE